ncbi:4910_t:CDS:1, partial [Ambispora leptoticha]
TILIANCEEKLVKLTKFQLLESNLISESFDTSCQYVLNSLKEEFFKTLGHHFGEEAVKKFRNCHYEHAEYLYRRFCLPRIINNFRDDTKTFNIIELDIECWCPSLVSYITGEQRKRFEEEDWILELDFHNVKLIFDPVVDKILEFIMQQILDSKPIDVIFLVGKFSEIPYFLKRVKEKFTGKVQEIIVPVHPAASLIRGSVFYGLNLIKTLPKKDLKWNYGIGIHNNWKAKHTSMEKSTTASCEFFHLIARKGTLIDKTQEFSVLFSPVPFFANQLNVNIYVTEKFDVKLCSDEGVKIFGRITVILPDFMESINEILAVKLIFYIGKNEFKTIAKDSQTDKEFETILDFNIDISLY